jgi:hypothetical protein
MADSPGTVEEQRARLNPLLQTLHTQVLTLPKMLPKGQPDSPIARYFADFTWDADESPYHAVDTAWTRTFKGTDTDKQALVLGGQHGLRMVYTFLSHFAKQPRMDKFDGLHLIYLRCTQLIELIKEV